MNIVIPMAGIGSRMNSSGNLPKPLINVNGMTMIEMAVETLNITGHYIFVTLKNDNEEINLNLRRVLENIKTFKTTIIEIEKLTEGPACSVLLAEDLIDNDTPLIVANCDQIMNWDAAKFCNHLELTSKDGLVVTYCSNTPKNSYVRIDNNENAVEFAEKKVISKHSINGIHYWKKGEYFVTSAKKMIKNEERINNEYYIAPSYNYLIKEGFKIGHYPLRENEHFSIGTSEDLERYLK
jgi:NDP-sugar pyrophosphorylase family protein